MVLFLFAILDPSFSPLSYEGSPFSSRPRNIEPSNPKYELDVKLHVLST